MKKHALSLAFFIALLSYSNNAISQTILITEVLAGDVVELYNASDITIDVTDYWLCDFPAYDQISDFDIICGSTVMEPGSTLVICGWVIDPADSELGLYTTNSFGNADAIVDYVEWGSSGHTRSGVAVAAGIWTTGNFIPALEDGLSAQKTELGDITSDAWHPGAPLLCRAFNDPPVDNEPCIGDLNSSTTVDVADVLILLGAFGGLCN